MAKKDTKTAEQPVEKFDLTEEQTAAIEVQSSISKGEKSKGKYKLKDPATSYSEPDFTLSGDQEKELPESPSTELVARIRSGFIKKV